ncbi:MAG: hypothetical protein PHW82_14540 [Bacteroidales bacterium]|nr:hypothetical protein [Bacteroidales bacterium]
MKTKYLYSLIASRCSNVTVIIACVFLIFASSCTKKEPQFEINNELIGTWNFIGFGNTETGTFRDVEKPQDCEDCYIFNFGSDGLFYGKTSKSYGCYYRINDVSIEFLFDAVTGTTPMDGDNGNFIRALYFVYTYQLNEQDELILFYYGEEFNYLLFNRTE